jgi:hypothetical protein
MAEVWNFDGLFSTSSNLSRNLVTTTQYTAIKYDENPASGTESFHVPLPRWSDYVSPPTNAGTVHGMSPRVLCGTYGDRLRRCHHSQYGNHRDQRYLRCGKEGRKKISWRTRSESKDLQPWNR